MPICGVVPLSEDQNIELMEKIVNDQRTLLQDVYNTSDVSSIPQVWTLCESMSLLCRHLLCVTKQGPGL